MHLPSRRHRFDPWVRKNPWRRKWYPTPVFLSGKFHGQSSLEGYSPWGWKTVGHDLATKQQRQQFHYTYVPHFYPLLCWWIFHFAVQHKLTQHCKSTIIKSSKTKIKCCFKGDGKIIVLNNYQWMSPSLFLNSLQLKPLLLIAFVKPPFRISLT